MAFGNWVLRPTALWDVLSADVGRRIYGGADLTWAEEERPAAQPWVGPSTAAERMRRGMTAASMTDDDLRQVAACG